MSAPDAATVPQLPAPPQAIPPVVIDTATYPSDLGSVPEARRHITDRLSNLPPEVVDDARVMACELMANSVNYARPGRIDLRIEVADGTLRIEVADAGSALHFPQIRTRVDDLDDLDDLAEGGRGLAIVNNLATRWGVHRGQPDKRTTVWFEIDLGTGHGD